MRLRQASHQVIQLLRLMRIQVPDTVIYTAIADDSLDISAGVIFSLTGDSDPALSIDPSTGEVTLSADADYETQSVYSFTVVASDGVNGDVEQSVTLDINNLDEIAPSITSGDTAVAIDENTGASQVIYTATATDDADTSAGVTFSLTGDSDPALSIDPSTGAVTLSADPNHETQSQYSFTVVASDGVNGDVEQSVTLDINNLDEVAPSIDSGDTAVAIDENTGAGQVVYTAISDDSLDISAGVTFSLSGIDAAAFTINEDSGEVTLIANPDHESQSEYNFTVVATDGAGNASEKLVSLAINNLDEVAPSITSGDTATAVDENSGEGQVVYTATASDTDFNDLEDITFSLADDSLGFSIDADTGVVTTNADFAADYENAESQSFTVVATDAAGNASEQVVSVAINNLDEVAPSITSGDTGTAVNENSGADQVVYTATASDTDFNGLEDITFSLADESLGFSIDASTGVVTTNADFAANYEDAQSQSFTVVATDVAGNASEQVVSVEINNLDEVAPSIDSGDTATAVDENSGAGQVVYTATASDTDFNDLEDITFSLADDSLGFSINADGVVTTNDEFAADYEDAQSQSFTVVATDEAGNSSEQVVSVAINNLDEVAPTITSGETAAVLESSGADTVVYRALVDDTADISEGVTFSLAEGSDPALSIDVTTGEVTLTDEPDFAIKPSYSFTVIADDGVNQSQKAVTLSVVDEDLEAPIFTSSATVAIDENIGETQVIYTAVTEDESLVTYSLSEDSDTDLSINSDTGAVTLTTNPDHESQSEYNFTVIAADIANNVSQQAVNVSVNDLDDAAPTITSGATAIAIDENSGSSQVVYTASADDTADISDGVTFSLTYDSDPALSIDPSTGKVTLTSDPDYETQSQYSFAVIATDAAGNESDAQSVTLDINNLDDSAPSITSGDTATAIDENSGASQVVYTATADDSGDEVSDTPITFSLTSDSDTALTIDPSTGVVTLNTDPDHETQSQYSFAVIATDAAGNESNAQSVTLNVNDLDDAAPTITSDATATSIDENSGAGQIIYTATADDSSDDVSDTPITFSLADGSDNALSIDSLTGEVTLSSDPDYEVQASYNFDVLATDAAGNVSAQQVVSVAINNLDEVAPSITSGDTATAIDENSGSGQVVYTATADDSLDTSDGVTFSLADEALGFSIDADGVVTTNDDFAADYENAQSQSFTVVATDGAGNASEQVVSVAINNLDEVAPSITSSTTADAIDENSGSGQVVYTATADDSLDTSDGVTFSLTDSDPALFIDSLTGEVTLMDNPDYEAQDFYSFTVVATDAAGNESFPQSVTLDINNLDEVAPSITSSTTVDAIDENSGSGQVVYTATADDSGDEVSDTPITFSLTSDSDPALFIDSLTGEVTLMDNPDYETQSFYSFTVVATDAAGNESFPQSVTLDINNLDEVAPSITSSTTADAIDENSGSGQVVYTATADDSLDTSDGVTFSLTDSDPALFIDSLTGEVTLMDNPDYEAQDFYSFTVVATDAAGNESFPQSVTLDINNLDEVAPSITSGDTATAIDENSGAGQVVYTATADDSLDTSNGFSFSLADESLGFSIESDTGVVITNDDFAADYEDAQSQSFTVVATDVAGNVSEQVVSVAINNLDEIAPSITSGDTATAIDENSGEGQIVYTATADDSLDTSDGVTFSLADESLGFSIDASTGVVTTNDDFTADYEDAQSQSFTVVATDVAGNASEQVVSVAINNLDEVAPSITSGDTATAIDENSGSGQVVYTATADDSFDTSDGVSFSLSFDSDPALYIDSLTGEVTLMDNPDYETQSFYSFTVVATDAAGNESFPQSVTLDINNLDEVAPSITSSTTADAIDENSGSGQVVYTATADDSFDTSDGVSFSLSFDSDPALYIDSLTGEVTLMDNPDYETQSFYSFTVVATDAAGNESFPQSVTLDINNLDEVAPSITSSTTADAIDENSGSGQVVYTATADDSLDTSDGVTFSLTDSDPALFIDSLTGEVTLMDNPDYEAQDFYSFTVVATDAAGNESFPQSVTLDINNLDEVAPSIKSGDTATAIDENSGASQVVYTATADDSLDTSNGFSFSLADDSLGFSIDASTGVVTTDANFAANYEDAQSQSFTVVVTDAADNVSEQVVSVAINNLDEIAPSITSGDTATAIDENSGEGQIVYTATADDSLDTSDGVTFSLADESLGFSIDADTGVVTTNADFAADYENAGSQSFTVVATDVAGNASDQVVSVAINNLDEVAPSITSGDTATAIDENSGSGQVVYTATADDSLDTSDGVTFSLADEALGFSIDADGVVTTNDDFAADYENAQSHSFTVVATDGAGNASEQVVSVAINNLDEVAPSITSGDTATAIDENLGSGQVVYTATADDSLDTSDGVTFSLADEALGFSIDADGVVTTNDDFAADYENAQSQSFTVVATDGAGNASEQVVSVAINNLDEVAPSITSGDTAVAIDENSGSGQVVYTATADDSLDTSDGVTFSLTDSDPALFIDSLTGEVTLMDNPDYETQSFYSFTVVAYDGVNEAVEQSVTLDINNLDEIAPTITSSVTADAIDENISSYRVVYTATADDSFDTSDGVSFSLSFDSDPALYIDSLTGEVTLMDNPDYESQDFYSFTVVATDAAGNESFPQSVTLDINNLDEVAPSITSGDTATAIDENSGAGQVVYTATADDSLDTSNGFSFSLADDSLGFSIDASTGVVTTDANFAANYEDAQSQSFTVVVTDAADNVSEQVVSVAINNLDEIAPSITSGDTATAIDENSGEGQVVYTATATDDADISAGFAFSLADESLGFSIDADTGVVTTNADFAADYEDAQSQSFTVVATDAADNVSEQVVSVAINNLDEVAPSITSGDTATAVNENSGADQVVYTATATDDADTSDGFSFSLADNSLGFSIDADTGVVTTNDDFAADYENAQSQSFTVVVTDAADNAADQVVSVAINNLDEVAPSITSGDTATAIDENSGSGQVVYTATADDSLDTSDGVTFSLADEALGFSIDADGVVTTNDDFAADYENAQSQSFTVVATDGAGNASEQVVSVAINNLDEVAPSITSGDTATAIDENSGSGQVVYTATADDSLDTSDGVTFSLTDSDPALFIDSLTGEVTLMDNPDYEAQDFYSFTVVATDAAGNESFPQSVTLDINNLDEVAPSITSGDTATAIDENSGAGQVVYTATADDSLDTSNGFSFSLADDSLGFSIDASTGVVTTDANFAANYEDAQSQSFTVVVTDAADNVSEQVVSVAINNLDEIAPSITSGDTATAIDENSGEGQIVYTATADDSLDTSDGVTFSLADESLGFSIDADTGVVTTNADFAADYENAGSQSFTVVATDVAGNATQQVVNVAINNLDEVAPVINSGDTASAIDENSGEGQVVYTATASDTDFNGLKDITFSLSGVDAGSFTINEDSGAVTLFADPNHETQSQYSFAVIATDGAGNESIATVSDTRHQ
jgi:hypothetical protein